MKKTLVSIVVIVFSILTASNVFATSGFFLGIQGGYSAQKPSLKDVEFNTNTTFLYGVRAGIKFLMVALEANYFQAAHNLELKELVTFSWRDRVIDYNFIGLNLKCFFPLIKVHPYLTLGYGYYTANIHGIEEDRKKGYNFGLGVELHLGSKFSLLAEGKYHYVKFDIEQRDLNLGNFTIIGGISLYLK